MAAAVIQIALTALLACTLTLGAIWIFWNRALKARLEAALAMKLADAVEAIRDKVQEGAESAIESQRDDIAATIEDRVKAGVLAAVDERIEEIVTTIEQRVQRGVEAGIEAQSEGVAKLIEQRVHDGARDGLHAAVAELQSNWVSRAKNAASKPAMERLDDAVNFLLGDSSRWKRR